MTTRFLFALLALFLLCPPPSAKAQKRKTSSRAAVVNEEAIDSLLLHYEFQKAESILTQKIDLKRRRKESTLREEEQLASARKAQQMMSAVERVVVFDSLIVNRDRILAALPLSQECGTVGQTRDLKLTSSAEGTYFRNEMGDQLFYALANDNDGSVQLYACDLFGEELGEGRALTELNDEETSQVNFPFMMADGTTLYYAKQGDDCLGGYDIFMTRYDADEKKFLIPENIGMPFNSPANDYLYCVDESYNIGCFVTDRGTRGDSVCIYYFIPNEARRVYLEEEVGSEALCQLARLSNIQLTWTEEAQVRGALARLRQCRSEQSSTAHYAFSLTIADNRVVHSLDELKNASARQTAQTWLQRLDDKSRLEQSLQQNRANYANANSQGKLQMRDVILGQETQLEALTSGIAELENQIRKQELGF